MGGGGGGTLSVAGAQHTEHLREAARGDPGAWFFFVFLVFYRVFMAFLCFYVFKCFLLGFLFF